MREVTSKHFGHLWVWSDHVGHFIETGAWWDQQIQPSIDGAVNKDAWALDLGANIGWFTIYMAGLFKHVLSVEAHPQTFELLRRNITERGLTNVTMVNQAAYDRSVVLNLAPTRYVGFVVTPDLKDCTGASSVAFGPDVPNELGVSIQGGPIDDLIPPDVQVACVKCDVQGADLRALMGLRKTIDRCRPRLIWEVEHGQMPVHGDTQQTYTQFFVDIGYTVTRIRADLWDYVSDPKEGLKWGKG